MQRVIIPIQNQKNQNSISKGYYGQINCFTIVKSDENKINSNTNKHTINTWQPKNFLKEVKLNTNPVFTKEKPMPLKIILYSNIADSKMLYSITFNVDSEYKTNNSSELTKISDTHILFQISKQNLIHDYAC